MKAVVVLGSAGAGKSTLIRELTASDLPVVSHRKFRDGTETITTIPALYDDALSFIDTPGLDSATYSTKVSEHIQSRFRDSTVLAVLVVSKTIPRITSYIKKFEAVLEDLFGNCDMTHFLFLWTNRSCDLSEIDRNDAQERFPRAVFHEVGEISTLKELIDGSTFYPLRVRVSVPRQTAQPQQRVAPSQTRPSQTRLTVNPPKVLMCVKSLGTLERFEKVKQDHNLSAVIAEVLKIKKNHALEYQNMKLMGDAFLKFYVLSYLKNKFNERELLHTKMLCVIGNDDSCPMPIFFNAFVKHALDQVFPGEKDNVSSHGKADVVEALIDLVRSKPDQSRTFKFMLSELTKSVA